MGTERSQKTRFISFFVVQFSQKWSRNHNQPLGCALVQAFVASFSEATTDIETNTNRTVELLPCHVERFYREKHGVLNSGVGRRDSAEWQNPATFPQSVYGNPRFTSGWSVWADTRTAVEF